MNRRSLLEPFQSKAYAILSAWSDRTFFLHKCQQSHSLWVSDLPRQLPAPAMQSAIRVLEANGFLCENHLPAHLLWMDISPSQYEALLAPLPQRPAALPIQDALHPAYALCRFLFLHPFALAVQPLSPLRDVLKAGDAASLRNCLSLIPPLHQQCAAWLREGRPLPHAVGSVLSAWLEDEDAIFWQEEDVHDSSVLRP